METEQRIPLWYKYFCMKIIELREQKTNDEIFFNSNRLGGYISGLLMAYVITTDEQEILSSFKDNARDYAVSDMSN